MSLASVGAHRRRRQRGLWNSYGAAKAEETAVRPHNRSGWPPCLLTVGILGLHGGKDSVTKFPHSWSWSRLLQLMAVVHFRCPWDQRGSWFARQSGDEDSSCGFLRAWGCGSSRACSPYRRQNPKIKFSRLIPFVGFSPTLSCPRVQRHVRGENRQA